MHRRRLLAILALTMVSHAGAKLVPRRVQLSFLPNGHVRLDGGPELDMVQLRAAIQTMKTEAPPPDIAFTPDASTKYDDVARILTIFREEHYGSKLGFTGMQQSDP